MTDGPNRFLYGHANPMSYPDPLGTMTPAPTDWQTHVSPRVELYQMVFLPVPYTGVREEDLGMVWQAIGLVDAAFLIPWCRRMLSHPVCGRDPDLDATYGSTRVYFLMTNTQRYYYGAWGTGEGNLETVGAHFPLPGGHGVAYNSQAAMYGTAVLAGVLMHEFAHIRGFGFEEQANEVTNICGLPVLPGSGARPRQ